MLEHRPFERLGRFDNDWLAARYHFNFSGYRERDRDGWGSLLVWNDDRIRAMTGFPRHPHRDMEIITYIRKGAITHLDHLGNQGRTEAGDVQVMSAGKGIFHEEHNREAGDTELFQIWIWPNERGVQPRWDQRQFPKAERAGQLVPLASGQPQHSSALKIFQDATIFGATLKAGQRVTHELGANRYAYLVPAIGKLNVNGTIAKARDGIALKDATRIDIEALEDSELLLADVPPMPEM
jgi:quercetin 2,3-dioxygenase